MSRKAVFIPFVDKEKSKIRNCTQNRHQSIVYDSHSLFSENRANITQTFPGGDVMHVLDGRVFAGQK